MKLLDLEAYFIKCEIRPCAGYKKDPNCSTVSPHMEHQYHVPVESIDEADGVQMLCPKCFADNHGDIGTHSVICWRPRVPPDVAPKPGRWEFVGMGIDDLTLVAGSSSVKITGGCNAHFLVQSGSITMCP